MRAKLAEQQFCKQHPCRRPACSALLLLQELVLGRLSGEHIGPRHPHALQQLTRLRFSGCKQLRSLHPSWCTLPSLLVRWRRWPRGMEQAVNSAA